MALGMEVGLGPCYNVLDGDPAPLPQKVAEPPADFQPIFVVAKGLDRSRCYMEVDLGPGHTVLGGDKAPRTGHNTPSFCSMSIVAKRSPISATAEHNLYLIHI